jgi:hypothetical protein
MQERRFNGTQRQRFEIERHDLLVRLKRVCAHLPLSDLEALALRMTRLRFKYEQFTAVPTHG